MINRIDIINLIIIKEIGAEDIVLNAPFNCISANFYQNNSFSKSEEDVHGVLYIGKGELIKDEKLYVKAREFYQKLPFIFIGNEQTDLTPRINSKSPFLIINRDHLTLRRVINVLTAMPQYRDLIDQQNILMEDVESTRMVADLNIERLHRTLKELESEKQKTEKANKAKQLFLANVTHELRTPLTAINGFAELFETNNLNKDQTNSIEIIREASSNLLNIVNDLLNYSKISDGKLTIYKEPFNLKYAVGNVYELLKHNADLKDLEFTLEYLIDEDVKVLGDRFRLKQVLTNLLSNAIKFTNKGRVILNVKKSLESNIVFTISDTGVGIKEERLESIFESYIQAEDGTTQEFGGTGLGLAIVKELINLQGGEITVKSKPNEGSEFSFQLSLPFVNSEVLQSNSENFEELDLTNISVLAVEDNYLNQMLIQKLLTSKVKKLVLAGDGIQAIEIAQTEKFDIILMDLQLPKMNGIEVVQKIREKSRNVETPVAVITANVWEEQLDLIKKSGIDTIIQKPFIKKDLYFQIYTLCNNDKSDSLISLNYLNQISGGDHFFIAEVLETYRQNIMVDMDKLHNAVKADKQFEAATIAHKMKSSFRMLEMKDACEICEKIELSQHAGTNENLIKVLNVIIDKSLIDAKLLSQKFSAI